MTPRRALLLIVVAVGFGTAAGRDVVTSFAYQKNDFSDPYCASRLWGHGQDPYDVALATAISGDRALSDVAIVPVYPPTAYVLISPLSVLPWRYANLLWAVLGFISIASVAYLLPKLVALSFAEDRGWLLAACVVCAAPLHTALHVGNSASIALALCTAAIYAADQKRDFMAGVPLAAMICLKPQLGIWLLIFYLARRRWKILLAATSLCLLVFAVAVLRIPMSPMALLHNYSANLHWWFGPGGINDFSAANPYRWQLVNSQVALYAVVHSRLLAIAFAWVLFGAGLAIWAWRVLRSRDVPDLPAISAILALGLIPVYHRSYDAAVLLLPLGWMLQAQARSWAGRAITLVVFAGLLLPGEWVVQRVQPLLSVAVTHSFWWNSGVSIYRVWAVLLLNLALLSSFATTVRKTSRPWATVLHSLPLCEVLSAARTGTEHA